MKNQTIRKEEPRTEILYARISKENMKWIKKTMRAYRYKSLAKFMDVLLDGMRKVNA